MDKVPCASPRLSYSTRKWRAARDPLRAQLFPVSQPAHQPVPGPPRRVEDCHCAGPHCRQRHAHHLELALSGPAAASDALRHARGRHRRAGASEPAVNLVPGPGRRCAAAAGAAPEVSRVPAYLFYPAHPQRVRCPGALPPDHRRRGRPDPGQPLYRDPR